MMIISMLYRLVPFEQFLIPKARQRLELFLEAISALPDKKENSTSQHTHTMNVSHISDRFV